MGCQTAWTEHEAELGLVLLAAGQRRVTEMQYERLMMADGTECARAGSFGRSWQELCNRDRGLSCQATSVLYEGAQQRHADVSTAADLTSLKVHFGKISFHRYFYRYFWF